jgi:hypothetical protein
MWRSNCYAINVTSFFRILAGDLQSIMLDYDSLLEYGQNIWFACVE